MPRSGIFVVVQPITIVAYLLGVIAILGAWDTIYYHEWKARLPLRGRAVHEELKLHAYRDFVYAILFGGIPWFAWHGLWSAALCGLLLSEVVLTLRDFVVEDSSRKLIGGLYRGERVMHAVIGLVYGAMLGFIVPVLWAWWKLPTSLPLAPVNASPMYRWLLSTFGLAVLLSGVRDLAAANGLPHSAWPWNDAANR